MREILFRGKAINRNPYCEYRTNYQNGDWVYGLVSKLFDSYFELPDAEMTNESGVSGIEVDGETVTQYTGLTDKNGVKIFEGDILSCDDYPYTSDGNRNYYAEVVWLDENAAFGLYTFKNPMSKVRGVSEGCDYVDDFESDVWEVIGNIYDNPELLGGDSNE